MSPMQDMDHESASVMSDEMAKEQARKAEAGPLRLERLEIKPTANGGYVVTCAKSSQAQGSGIGPMAPHNYKSEDYAFSSRPEVMAFLTKELGGEAEPEPESDEDGYEDVEA